MKVGAVECIGETLVNNQNKTIQNFLKNKKAPKSGLFFLSTKRKSVIAFSILFKLTLT